MCVSDDFTFKCLYTIFPSITNQVDKNISCLLYSNLVEFCFDYIWCLKTAENLIVDIDIFNER